MTWLDEVSPHHVGCCAGRVCQCVERLTCAKLTNEANIDRSVLSFYRVSPESWAQVIRTGGKPLPPAEPSYLLAVLKGVSFLSLSLLPGSCEAGGFLFSLVLMCILTIG